MKDEKPEDQLSKTVSPDSGSEKPQVYALKREGSRWVLNRRDFMIAAAAAQTAMSGCLPQLQERGAAGQKGRKSPNVFAHTQAVRSLAISPDGKILASASGDKTIRLWSLPEGELRMCLMDLKASPKKTKGIQYKARDARGQWVTYTLPFDSPIPAGAVCICNCVPGSWTLPTPSIRRPPPPETPPALPRKTPSPSRTPAASQPRTRSSSRSSRTGGGHSLHYWFPN